MKTQSEGTNNNNNKTHLPKGQGSSLLRALSAGHLHTWDILHAARAAPVHSWRFGTTHFSETQIHSLRGRAGHPHLTANWWTTIWNSGDFQCGKQCPRARRRFLAWRISTCETRRLASICCAPSCTHSVTAQSPPTLGSAAAKGLRTQV